MACFPIKQAPKHGQNEACHTKSVLRGKEISGGKSYCAFSTIPAGRGDVNKDGQAVPCRSDAKNLTQFFVKVCGNRVSMQEDLNSLSVKQLIKTVCKKKGIRAYDFYAVHDGKPLKDNKLISSYPVYRDSTVFLRHRLRAGCPQVFPFKFCTFDEMIKSHEGGLFRRVNLSQKSISSKTNQNEVTFLSYFSQYIAHQVLVYVCGKHRKGLSFNGKFESIHILFSSGRVKFSKDVERVDFTETACHEDYKKLKEIFGKCFTIKTENNMPVYPMYVPHLLNYLEKCPGGILSNQEPLIALLTNHPALVCYMDRIKQCILLDNVVHALQSAEKQPLQANLGSLYSWTRDILSVPEMKGRYLHKAKINPKTKRFIVNAEYTESRFGCLHYSRNYFRHAYLNLLNQEEAEAAFAMHLDDFLPSLLEIIALKIARAEFIPPIHFDILTLLRNNLADKNTGKKPPNQNPGN